MSNYLIHRKDKQFALRDNKLGVSPTFFKTMKSSLNLSLYLITWLTINACYVAVMESDLIADFQQLFVTICLFFHWPQAIEYDKMFWPTMALHWSTYFFLNFLHMSP